MNGNEGILLLGVIIYEKQKETFQHGYIVNEILNKTSQHFPEYKCCVPMIALVAKSTIMLNSPTTYTPVG